MRFRLVLVMSCLCFLAGGTESMAQNESDPRESVMSSVAASSATRAPGVGGVSPEAADAPVKDMPAKVLRLDLDGGIFGGISDYLVDGVKRAEAEGVPFLLVLDTPGGALEATRDIVKAFLGSRVPIIVWVGPAGARAGSAGVFLTMAANVASMAPGTNIGAAHPVGVGVGAPGRDDEATDEGKQKESKGARPIDDREVMAKKIENDTLAFIESIAGMRGRNVDWAKSAVKDSVSVIAEKALELHVIDLLARDLPSLMDEIDGRVVDTAGGKVRLNTKGAEIVSVPMSTRQSFLSFIADPNLVYILFVLGMLGIYLELNHPGAIIPAVVGGVSLILALTGLSILPYNATGILFLIIAGACFVAEAYVASFGLLTVGGAVSLVLGAILLFDTPSDTEKLVGEEFGVSPWVYGSAALLSIAIVIPVAYLIARAQLRRPKGGGEGLIGLVGEALTDIDSEKGRVFVHGEYWEARATSSLPAGEKVIVCGLEGLVLSVVQKDS